MAIKFNSAAEIYETIMSGQDLYCLDTKEFFTMFDDLYIAIHVVDKSKLKSYAEIASDYGERSIYDEIPGYADVLEPNIITPDGDVVSPGDDDYEDVDIAEYDPSNIIEALSDLAGKDFINANVADLL
jgi:iron only hydrogenase large subunit-like protein